MDITKLATRFAEIYASNAKKSVSTLEKDLEKAGFGDEHAVSPTQIPWGGLLHA